MLHILQQFTYAKKIIHSKYVSQAGAADFDSFPNQLHFGVGLHALQFADCQAGICEDLHGRVIDAHSLDAAAAIDSAQYEEAIEARMAAEE